MAGPIESFGNNLDQIVSTFAEDTSAAMITELGPAILAGTTLYFTLKGWMFLTGRAHNAIPDTVMSAFKVALIAFFAMNAGNFTSFMIGGLSSIDSMFAKSLSGADSSFASIDTFWSKLFDQIKQLLSFSTSAFGDAVNPFSNRTISEALWLVILVLAILFVSVLLTFLALATFILCKVGLAVVMGFGPLFLCTLMFPVTRNWFDGWLKTCLSMVVSTSIIAAILALCTHIFDKLIAQIGAHLSKPPEPLGFASLLGEVMIFLFVAAAIAYLIKQIPSIASALVGGVGLRETSLSDLLKNIPKLKTAAALKGSEAGAGVGMSGSGLKGFGSGVAGFIPSPAGGGSGGALTDARANRALLSSSAKPMLSHSPDANARVINLGGSPSPSGGSHMKAANSVGSEKVRNLAYRAYGLGGKRATAA